MARDDRLTVEQMLEVVRRIRAIARGQSREAFDGDEVRQLALLHLIQMLGEASIRTSCGGWRRRMWSRCWRRWSAW